MAVTRATIARAVLQTSGLCWYCGTDVTHDPQIDHVVPRSKGGADEPENLVVCCRSCNSQKRNRNLEEYRQYLNGKSPATIILNALYEAEEAWPERWGEPPEDLHQIATWVAHRAQDESHVFHGEAAPEA